VTAGVLETPRLVLRPYAPDDLDELAALYADETVTAYTKLGRRDRAQTAAILNEYVALWAARGFGMYALRGKADGAYAGECGLFEHPDGGIALRYALHRRAWGRGLAVEASRAVIEDAFARTDLVALQSVVQARNTASLAVMAKLGWPEARRIVGGPHELVVFALTREQCRSPDSAGEPPGP
jgi:RimJ/RimL family protein N-acetyltransferase